MIELFIIITAVFAGMLAYYINIILGKGPVIGSSIITLSSGLLLPTIFPDMGIMLAAAASTAGYASMVAKSYVENVYQMSILGLITGVLYLATLPVFQGIGGKLGTVAAIACLTFIGFRAFLTLDILTVEKEE